MAQADHVAAKTVLLFATVNYPATHFNLSPNPTGARRRRKVHQVPAGQPERQRPFQVDPDRLTGLTDRNDAATQQLKATTIKVRHRAHLTRLPEPSPSLTRIRLSRQVALGQRIIGRNDDRITKTGLQQLSLNAAAVTVEQVAQRTTVMISRIITDLELQRLAVDQRQQLAPRGLRPGLRVRQPRRAVQKRRAQRVRVPASPSPRGQG